MSSRSQFKLLIPRPARENESPKVSSKHSGHLRAVTLISSKPETAKRKRHEKKKTGCITCKRRRVRCDEGRPACKRCIDFGLTCDGYANNTNQPSIPPKLLRSAILPRPREQKVPLYALSDLVGTHEDKKCFHFFQLQTASQLQGHFDAGFWTHLLLQISHSEPIVWHSVLALSKLHEQYTMSSDQRGVQISNSDRRFAIKHYNESIARLNAAFSNPHQSTEVVLVGCIVFIGLELLLGNTDGAMVHLRCGIQILRSWQERKSKSSSDTFMYSGLMDRYLTPIFHHMNLHACIMYGSLALPQPERHTARRIKTNKSFDDLVEARAVLLDIMNEGLQLANQTMALGDNLTQDRASFQQKQSLVSRSRDWKKAFGALLSTPSMKYLSLQDSQKVALLWVKQKTAAIWIANSLNTTEKSFDNYVQEFEDITTLAESTFEKELELLKGEEYANFSVQMQVISLYYTTIKCRNPSIRRRTLALLKRCSRTEGFWDSRMVIEIAERVIETEEVGLEDQKDLTGVVVPSEWSRVHEVAVTPENVGNSRRALISFRQRPSGDPRQWLLRHESFDM